MNTPKGAVLSPEARAPGSPAVQRAASKVTAGTRQGADDCGPQNPARAHKLLCHSSSFQNTC